MTIKDVEKITGLTAKSIRLYEERGLLNNITRNNNNDYRTYTEENLEKLKKIKLFRYLGFSIQEIKNLDFNNHSQIKENLKLKKSSYSETCTFLENQENICDSLIKDYENNIIQIDTYIDSISFLESDEFYKQKKELLYITTDSIYDILLSILLYLCCIFCMFYCYKTNHIECVFKLAFIAIILTIVNTLLLKKFLIHKKKNATFIKEKSKKEILLIPVLVLSIILFFTLLLFFYKIQEYLLIPNDTIYTDLPTSSILFLILFLGLLFLNTILPIVFKIKNIKNSDNKSYYLPAEAFIFEILSKNKKLLILVAVICLYISFFNVTFITNNSIIHYSPLHPFGINYTYSDIEYISTGFYENSNLFLPNNKKGEFYYFISIDNKKIFFSHPEDYNTLKKFDSALVSLNICKYRNTNCSNLSTLDFNTLQQLITIINN